MRLTCPTSCLKVSANHGGWTRKLDASYVPWHLRWPFCAAEVQRVASESCSNAACPRCSLPSCPLSSMLIQLPHPSTPLVPDLSAPRLPSTVRLAGSSLILLRLDLPTVSHSFLSLRHLSRS